MTDPEYVHYILIIDRSGSMKSIEKDMNGGIRSFIDKQLEGVDGNKRTVSLYQFDTEIDRVYDFALLEKAKDYTLVPRGGTALLDACGQAITEVGAQLAAMPEERRPGYVMVMIVTDGQENSSKKYSRSRVKNMIEHQQGKYDWRVTYIAADVNAFSEAGSIGIATPSVLSYIGTSRSTNAMWNVASASVSMSTTPTSTMIYYSDEQRDSVV